MTKKRQVQQEGVPTSWGSSALQPVLGVDIGRVIAADDEVDGISMLSDSWRETVYVEGSKELLAELQDRGRFHDSIYLVSKCGSKVEDRTRQWLQITRFFEETAISASHLYFVRDAEGKAAVCQRLGVSHFIDDRIKNLTLMGSVRWRYLFAPVQPPQVPPWALHVRSWSEFARRLADSAP